MSSHPIKRRPFLAAAEGTLVAAPGARAAALDPPCEPVRGVASGGVTAFLGLPYAVPPTGPLRYASPRPAPRWTEPHDGTQGGAASIQTLGGAAAWLYDPAPRQDEDCLVLKVWTARPHWAASRRGVAARRRLAHGTRGRRRNHRRGAGAGRRGCRRHRQLPAGRARLARAPRAGGR